MDHCREQNIAPPDRPTLFAKFPSSVIAPGEPIRWPADFSEQVDYEAELAVVIGRTTRRVAEADALAHVFGYTAANDVTARDVQRSDKQWIRGKAADTFCPLGPVVVTADEMPDPQQLPIGCRVNGETRQASHTREMIFPVRAHRQLHLARHHPRARRRHPDRHARRRRRLPRSEGLPQAGRSRRGRDRRLRRPRNPVGAHVA